MRLRLNRAYQSNLDGSNYSNCLILWVRLKWMAVGFATEVRYNVMHFWAQNLAQFAWGWFSSIFQRVFFRGFWAAKFFGTHGVCLIVDQTVSVLARPARKIRQVLIWGIWHSMYRPGCHIRRLLPFRQIGPLSCTAHAISEKAAWTARSCCQFTLV